MKSIDLRNKLLQNNRPYKCENCGCDGHWQNGMITLHVHHIDGNHQNNDISNLQFLCPNCHALTDSYCISRRPTNFDKDKFLELFDKGYSIRQCLLKMGLSDGSSNYKTAYQVLDQTGRTHQLIPSDVNYNNVCLRCGKPISNNAHYCEECCHIISRQVERPDAETLLEEVATSSFVQVGAKYNVSDRAIAKWCEAYGLPTHKKDLVELYHKMHS